MNSFAVGQVVTVSPSLGRAFCAVIEAIDADRVVVRSAESGTRRSYPIARVRTIAERRPLGGVGEAAREAARRGTTERREGRAVPKELPREDEAYLAYVRTHPCMTPGCGAPAPSEAHHWAPRGSGGGGTARKVDDRRTVPLCRRCHQRFHDSGELPGLNRALTRGWFLRQQVDLLVEWVGKRR